MSPSRISRVGLYVGFGLVGVSCGQRRGAGTSGAHEAAEQPPAAAESNAAPEAAASWDFEAFQDAAQAQLVDILDALQAGDPLGGLVADPDNAVLGTLRPDGSEATLSQQRGLVRVLRWKPDRSPSSARAPLVTSFSTLRAAWPKAAEPRIAVKHFNVQPPDRDGVATTLTDFRVYASGESESVQAQAKWRCRWKVGTGDGDRPSLVDIELLELEEVRDTHGGRGSVLVDVTVPLLGELPAFRESLRHDANYWITRLPHLKHRFQNGIAVGDVDGDGHEDLYLCQPETLPNLLLLRQPDGSVREAAAEFALDFKDLTTSALLADFDNDGDQDLAAAFRSPFDFFENVDGKFVRRFGLPHLGQIFSLAVADYDADGLLDLFVCRYQNYDQLGRAKNPVPLHDAQNGGVNALLRNLGDWQFEDVTKRVGLDQNNTRWSIGASWEDYDLDGDLDLYVANDYGRNNLYRCDRNDGAVSFVDVAPSAGVEDMTTSMGVIWGDPNRDGRPDLYVSNMYSSAGRRVTYQKNFKRTIAGSDQAHVETWRQAAMGNSLFQGGEGGAFTHVSAAAGVQNGLWSWGAAFADINHDGWEDLLVANGFITGPSAAPDL